MVQEDKPQGLLALVQAQIDLVAQMPDSVAGKSTDKVRASLKRFLDALVDYYGQGASLQHGMCIAVAKEEVAVAFVEPDSTSEAINWIRNTGSRIVGYTTGEDGIVWYELQGGGWVCSDSVTLHGQCESLPLSNISREVPTHVITRTTATLREGPGVEYDRLRSLTQGQAISVLNIEWHNGYFWMHVRLPDNTTGWLREGLVGKEGKDFSGVMDLEQFAETTAGFDPVMAISLTEGFIVEPIGGEYYQVQMSDGTLIENVRIFEDNGQLFVDLPDTLFRTESGKSWSDLEAAYAEDSRYWSIGGQYALTALVIAWKARNPNAELTLGDFMALVRRGEYAEFDVEGYEDFISDADEAIVRNIFDRGPRGVCSEDPRICEWRNARLYAGEVESIYNKTFRPEDDPDAPDDVLRIAVVERETLEGDLLYWDSLLSFGQAMTENPSWWETDLRGQGPNVPSRWGNVAILHTEFAPQGGNLAERTAEVTKYLKEDLYPDLYIASVTIHRECGNCTEVLIVTGTPGIPSLSYCHKRDPACA